MAIKDCVDILNQLDPRVVDQLSTAAEKKIKRGADETQSYIDAALEQSDNLDNRIDEIANAAEKSGVQVNRVLFQDQPNKDRVNDFGLTYKLEDVIDRNIVKINEWKQNPEIRINGKTILNKIRNTPGVKKDEIEWTGLDKYLEGTIKVNAYNQKIYNDTRLELEEKYPGEIINSQAIHQEIARKHDLKKDNKFNKEEVLYFLEANRVILDEIEAVERENESTDTEMEWESRVPWEEANDEFVDSRIEDAMYEYDRGDMGGEFFSVESFIAGDFYVTKDAARAAIQEQEIANDEEGIKWRGKIIEGWKGENLDIFENEFNELGLDEETRNEYAQMLSNIHGNSTYIPSDGDMSEVQYRPFVGDDVTERGKAEYSKRKEIWEDIKQNITPATVGEMLENIEDLDATALLDFIETHLEVHDLLGDNMRDKYEEAMRNELIEQESNYPTYEIQKSEQGYTLKGSEDAGITVEDSNGNIINEQNPVYSWSEAEVLATNHAWEEGVLNSEEESDAETETARYAGQWINDERPYTNYREIKLTLPNNPNSFQTEHYEDENQLSFMRVTDRSTGFSKVFFIDEFQSDWHQFETEGEREVIVEDGKILRLYATEENIAEYKERVEVAGKEYDNALEEIDKFRVSTVEKAKEWAGAAYDDVFYDSDQYDGNNLYNVENLIKYLLFEYFDNLGFDRSAQAFDEIQDHVANYEARFGEEFRGTKWYERWEVPEGEMRDYIDNYIKLRNEVNESTAKLNKARSDISKLKPDAPFKNKGWMHLTLKRALIRAVEEGYESIAWPNYGMIYKRWGESIEKAARVTYNNDMVNIIKKTTGEKPEEFVWEGSPEIRDHNIIGDIMKDVTDAQYFGWKADEPMTEVRAKFDKEIDKTMESVKSVIGLANNFGFENADEFMKAFLKKVNDDETGHRETLTKMMVDNALEHQRKTGKDDLYDSIHPDDVNYLVKAAITITNLVQHRKDLVGYWEIPLTEEIKKKVYNNEFTLFQKREGESPRGQIQLQGPDMEKIITLFEGKNLTTLLHEFSHLFLQTRIEIVNEVGLENLSENFKKDWGVTLQWLGVENTSEIGKEQHEKFARGFEEYLYTGKAPSMELRRVFRRVSAWFVDRYEDIKEAYFPKISKEISEVFDRMVATQEQIEAFRNQPSFRVEENLMNVLTPAERKAWTNKHQNEIESAKERLLVKTLAQVTRKKRKQWKDARAAIREKVEKEVNAQSRYRAHHYIRYGKFLDGETSSDLGEHKLEKDKVKETYGTEVVNSIPRNLMTTYGKQGAHPDILAEMFGYKDAGVMLADIANITERKNYINKLTNQRMEAEYGNYLTDGTIEAEAIEQVEEKERGARIAYELKILGRLLDKPVLSREAAYDRAEKILNEKTMDENLKENKFYRDEVNAARKAGKALGKKDYETAAHYKQIELLNHALFRAAKEKRVLATKAQKLYKTISKKPTKKRGAKIDESFQKKALALLSQYQLGSRMSEKKMEQLTHDAFTKWQAEKEKDDAAIFIKPPELAAAMTKTHWRDMTGSEFQALYDTVNMLYHQGKGIRTIEIDGVKVNKLERVDMVGNQIEQMPERKEDFEQEFGFGPAKISATDYFMSNIKATTFIRQMDGYKELGVVYKTLASNIIKKMSHREKRMREEGIKVFDMLEKHYGKNYRNVRQEKITLELKGEQRTLRREEIIIALANYGNIGNRERLMLGEGWTEQDIQNIFKHIRKEDAEFVQEMWLYVDSFWGEASELFRRRYGFTPEKVEAAPFEITTIDGETILMNGGYFPVKWDANRTSFVPTDSELMTIEDLKMGQFSTAMTKHGFMMNRGKNVGKPLKLTFSSLFNHMNEMINDIEMGAAIDDSWAVFNNSKIRTLIDKKLGPKATRQIEWWYKDIASGQLGGGSALESFIDHLRSGTTISTLGLAYTTTAVQIIGITQSWERLGAKALLKGIVKAYGIQDSKQINKNWKMVLEKSEFMRDRSTTFQRDLYDALRKLERGKHFQWKAAKVAFWPIVMLQRGVDMPTWLGAYDKGLKDFNGNEADAIEFADMVVRQSQGSGLIGDLAAIERGTVANTVRINSLVRSLTLFMTFFNATLNRAYERTSQFKQGPKKPRDVGRLMGQYTLLFILPAILSEYLLNREPDEEDDDPENWLWWAFKTSVKYGAGSFPVIRDGASYLIDGYNVSPIIFKSYQDALGIATAPVKRIKSEFTDDEYDNLDMIQDITKSVGVLLKLPTRPFTQVMRAMEEVQEGGDPDFPIDYLRTPPR